MYEEAIDTLYRATWDYAYHSSAYLELARISCLAGDFQKALQQVNHSLSTNSKNNCAINLRASLLRQLGDVKTANAIVSEVIESDPLDFRARNEIYLLSLKEGESQEWEKKQSDLNRKMRGFARNYLELAVGYMNDGLFSEAEDVLRRFTGKDQIIQYYLGYIEDKKGNRSEARQYFQSASDQDVDYGFPYRLETVKVLKLASEYHSDDAKPHYYLGNLLYDKQPQNAIKNWEKAVEIDPSLAIAWRNLGWGYYHHGEDLSKSIAAYERAFETKQDDPVYYAELDPLYEMNNTPIEKRARLFDGKNEIVKKRDDAFVREIIVLNLAGESEKAVDYLNNSNFHFREGSSRVRDITVDAHLLLGRKYLNERKFQQALEQFMLTVDSSGDTVSEGVIVDPRGAQIHYFIGLASEFLGDQTRATSNFTVATDHPQKQEGYLAFYQGQSFLKLGQEEEAEQCFNSLIEAGTRQIEQGSEIDFFAKFGERETEMVQRSNAHMMIGLGYKGLGESKLAIDHLTKAVELSASNLWATVELD